MNVDPLVETGFWAALGLKLVNVAAGAVGAFVSLRFFDNLGTLQKWTTFLGGWGLAAYGGAPLTAYFELKPALETGITLVIGLFGMSLAAAIIKAIQDVAWGTIISDAARAIVKRVIGGDGKGKGNGNGGGRP